MNRIFVVSLAFPLLLGCNPSRYRVEADREASALIAEKVVDPSWNVEVNFGRAAEDSRFSNPNCIDHPPKPSDDPMAAAVVVDPQPSTCCAPQFENDSYLKLLPIADVESGELEYLLDPLINSDETPRVVHLENAYEVALLNNRFYQDRRESLFLAALDVSLERTAFAPQLFGTGKMLFEQVGRILDDGDSATEGASRVRLEPGDFDGTTVSPGDITLGSDILSGQATDTYLGRGPLSGTGFGFTRLFQTGGALLFQFANETVFGLAGPITGTNSQSSVAFQLIQPLLQGGGRAIALEPLTQTERNLLYELRDYVRFQKEFFTSIVSANDIPQSARLDSTIFTQFFDEDDPESVGFFDLLEQDQIVRNEQANLEFLMKIAKGFEELEDPDTEDELDYDEIMQEVHSARASVTAARQDYFTLMDLFKLRLGVPTNLPLVLDPSLLNIFELQSEGCVLPRLPPSLAQLGYTPREVEGIALSHRLDLMNSRANVMDRWRKIGVARNALLGVLDVGYEAELLTPEGSNQPFSFDKRRAQHNVSLNVELPFLRVEERNIYRATIIEYQRSRRQLLLAEDTVRLDVRTALRNYEAARRTFEIQRDAVLLACQRVEKTRTLLTKYETEEEEEDDWWLVDAFDLIFAQEDLLEAQNALATAWVAFLSARVELVRDMGILDPISTPVTALVGDQIPGLPTLVTAPE